jgi:hypothetical protein
MKGHCVRGTADAILHAQVSKLCPFMITSAHVVVLQYYVYRSLFTS